MPPITVRNLSGIIKGKIALPASKSESNRALIIHALSGKKGQIHNLSNARDTQTMIRLLQSDEDILDVLDAGTTMRFLSAYCAVKYAEKTLTGTERMCERPIGILTEALKELGADIAYLEKEGYPPVKIKKIREQITRNLRIRGDVSSQYISALCMIAPVLPLGLRLELTGEIGSRPYIQMTLQMMADFGIGYTFEGAVIDIHHQEYKSTEFYAESDWSGASYWYSIAALAKEADLELEGLKAHSLQGDAAIAPIMEKLGVHTRFVGQSAILTKIPGFILPSSMEIDFSNCPDIAQTLAALCAALGVKLTLTGVESLKIKETDRLAALKNELEKAGVNLAYLPGNKYLLSGEYDVPRFAATHINTYKDHRMAMAFAPLGLLGEVHLEDSEVVVKSYPDFWNHLIQVGFSVNK